MAKYQVQTDKGTYLVETADPPAADALTGGQTVPDAMSQARASALAHVPPELRGYTPSELAQRTDTSNPISPLQSVSLADQVNNSYRQGAEQVGAGVAQMAQPSFDEQLGGASKIIRGGMNLVKQPALVAGAITNPVATGVGLVAGTGAQKAAHAGLKAVGASDNLADFVSDVAGLVGGGAAAHGADYVGQEISDFGLPFYLKDPKAGIPSVVRSAGEAVSAIPGALAPIKTNLDPAEASAVQYGRDNGVKMPVSVQTGSKVAANAENILQNLPFASGVAKTARAAEKSSLASAGAREVDNLGANPGAGVEVPQPLDAGEAIQNTALANEKAHGAAANDSYDLLRSIENRPEFKSTLQVGTKRVDAGVDENGNPVTKIVPDMQDVQLPVDYRGLKAAVKPLLAETLRPMSIAQEQSSTGIKAMRNILDSPDFVPASVADQDLGALKGIMRDSPQSRSVGQAKFAADLLSKQVDNAVQRAGPDAVAALKQGRASTVAKYDAQDFQKDIGFQNVGTGNVTPGSAVDLVTKLTRDGDRSISLLRSLQEHAPEHIPALAQTVVQGLLDKVTAEAGMGKPTTALSSFQKLGDQTKNILFRDPATTQRLTDFFTLAKKMSENPNPSGSGSLLAMGKAGMMVLTQPHIGVPALLGSKVLAKMLFNPETSRLMQTAMKMPANSGAAGDLVSRQLLQAAGQSAGTSATAQPLGQSMSASNGLARTASGSGEAAASAPAGGQTAGASGGGLRPGSTFVPVPGKSGAGYSAQYKLRELSDVNASHNGLTFQPNPKYGLSNDRDYTNAANQGKVVNWSSRSAFDPSYLVSDVNDALTGPPVTDAAGNVLGGNGRKMILDRVHAGNPTGTAAYRDLLTQKAAQFGIDPAAVKAMKQPVLTREIPDTEFKTPDAKQNAVTDFNVKGTADLTPAERAISDSRRVSQATLEDVASRLDEHGEGATIADVLAGKSGTEVLGKLIHDGVIAPQEGAALEDANGLTPAGKDRISALMIGRFFSDPKQLDTIPRSIRNQVERVAAPLAQVEGKPEWNLSPEVQSALNILDQAHKLGIKNVDDFIKQDGLFGKDRYSDKAVTLAKAFAGGMKSKAITAAFRQYAQDAAYAAKGANTLMGDAPTPETSFADAFPKPAANALSKK